MYSGSHPVSMYWSVCPAALMEVCGDRKLAWRYAFTLLRPMNKDLQLQRVERTSAWITGEINGNVTVNQASVFNHCSSLSTSHFVETDCLIYLLYPRTEHKVRSFRIQQMLFVSYTMLHQLHHGRALMRSASFLVSFEFGNFPNFRPKSAVHLSCHPTKEK